MIKIRNRIEKELPKFILRLDKQYSLSKISPLLIKHIKEFISRSGKRVRPTLFVIGYLGFSNKVPPDLFTSALSIELLHDFMLVHDDIIDKSDTRRGKPSMHKMFNNYLKQYENLKFNGTDLAIVSGDIMYAMGINAFLSISVEKVRKERALKKLIEAALFTGCGEFIELIYGAKPLEKITQRDIYKIYDYKTACYTFASPLVIGATLAGANDKETQKLYKYGIYLGRAFQIKDDILGIYGNEKEIGKSTLTDLQEAKKTILIWYAFKHGDKKNKSYIKKILGKGNAKTKDLIKMRKIISDTKALDFAKREIDKSLAQAEKLIHGSKLNPRYKNALKIYSEEILSV